jgi:hypothetical protein
MKSKELGSTPDQPPRARPGAGVTILLGGLAIGVLDFLDATLFFRLYYGVPFQRIWQGVSSGLVGAEAARSGGWNTALLGILLHFVVSFCVATVYYVAARNIPFLIRRPVISGMVFGVLAHLVMRYVVIPLSAIGTISPYDLPGFLNSVIAHALVVGLPVALLAAWSAKPSSRATVAV